MLKEKVDSLKNTLIKVDNTDNKKSIEKLVMTAIVLIVTLIAVNYILKGDNKKKISDSNNLNEISSIDYKNTSLNSDAVNNSLNNLEERLSEILSKISGVGEVKVLLSYSESNRVNPIYNEDQQTSTTEETDTEGGKRMISSVNNKKEVVYSNNSIVTESISSPQIQGAVVIAKGASDTRVKSDIIQAVAAATGLSTYKIQVFEMN